MWRPKIHNNSFLFYSYSPSSCENSSSEKIIKIRTIFILNRAFVKKWSEKFIANLYRMCLYCKLFFFCFRFRRITAQKNGSTCATYNDSTKPKYFACTAWQSDKGQRRRWWLERGNVRAHPLYYTAYNCAMYCSNRYCWKSINRYCADKVTFSRLHSISVNFSAGKEFIKIFCVIGTKPP